MAMDMFIKIKDIPGESKDKAHKDEIDVLAWSWGASNSGTQGVGGGGSAGKVNMQDISFTKYIDKSSPKLLLSVCNGVHIPEATLTVRKAGGTAPIEYYVIKITDLIVTSVSTGGSGGEDKLTENVTLNFAKIGVAYKEQDEKGAQKGGDVTAGWDIKQNVKA